MEMQVYGMKEFDKKFINEVSTATGILEAFIEKDYYVTELIRIIGEFQSENFNVVFTGGTSLSKGFKIINRFSEDIDFMVFAKGEDSRSVYRTFRKVLFDRIDATGVLNVSKDEMIVGNESRFFSFYVDYPKLFDEKSLRQQVKVEVSARSIRLAPENKRIDSRIDEYLGIKNGFQIDCLSPLETAANKFSAFLWRADCKDRSSTEKKLNDPTIVRHLYDLYKLQTFISANEAEFYKLILQIYEDDKKRGDSANTRTLKEFAESTCARINADAVYEKEYTDFVNNMVYKTSDLIPYSVVFDCFSSLVNKI